MIDGSEKCNGWLNLEFQSLHVIKRCSKEPQLVSFQLNNCICLIHVHVSVLEALVS